MWLHLFWRWFHCLGTDVDQITRQRYTENVMKMKVKHTYLLVDTSTKKQGFNQNTQSIEIGFTWKEEITGRI